VEFTAWDFTFLETVNAARGSEDNAAAQSSAEFRREERRGKETRAEKKKRGNGKVEKRQAGGVFRLRALDTGRRRASEGRAVSLRMTRF
jgi:hypothetical protein